MNWIHSAILLLLRQRWRISIIRFAAAMTLFAVACAVMFPLLHTGRPWLAAYWLLPLPNANNIWVNFRSPLIWDVFAVSTYGLVSFLFWYTGLIPDLAIARDRAKNKVRKFVYGLMSLAIAIAAEPTRGVMPGMPAMFDQPMEPDTSTITVMSRGCVARAARSGVKVSMK